MHVKEFTLRMMELMPVFMRAAMQQENNYLTQGKITFPQFWALSFLYTTKVVKMSDLAEYLHVSRPAATGIIDRLIASGFVSRRADAQDRRVIWIGITSKGKSIVSEVRKQKFESIMKIFSKISAQEREQYLKTIEQVSRVLNEDLKTHESLV